LRHFAHQLRTGRLPGVTLVREKLKVVPLQAATPPEAEALDRKLDALLPRVRITELLLEVAERTGFLSAFRDVRSGKEHDKPAAVLAAILADGTISASNAWPTPARASHMRSSRRTQNWYISPENYEAALAQIVREHHRLPFARNWAKVSVHHPTASSSAPAGSDRAQPRSTQNTVTSQVSKFTRTFPTILPRSVRASCLPPQTKPHTCSTA
jgi:hypothetical protein